MINNSQKRYGRAYKSFLAKVVLLEEWVVEGGVPEGEFLPTGPKQLAEWHDPSRGLYAWTSPNVASPNGAYPDLRIRFDRSVEVLSETKKLRNRKDLNSEIRELKVLLRGQAEQNVQLLERVTLLEEDRDRQKHLVLLANQRERELIEKLSIKQINS